MAQRTKVFISYSRRDARWLKRLQVHLKPLERVGLVDRWDDTRIAKGNDWRKEIKEALAATRVAVLLISADFMASDFIVENELPPLLAAAEDDGVVILPVILSDSQFAATPSLSRFQAVNSVDRPLAAMGGANREKVLKEVADQVLGALRSAREESAESREPSSDAQARQRPSERQEADAESGLTAAEPPPERRPEPAGGAATAGGAGGGTRPPRGVGAAVVLLALVLGLGAWAISRVGCVGDPIVTVTLLHLNDVSEIGPIDGGRVGGLARVATLRNRLRAEDPNVRTFLAGDFLSPSAMGALRFEGERVAGRHMVEVLNAMGLDYATFGNHEFDLDESSFYRRLRESKFQWISSNVFDAAGEPFPGVVPQVLLTIEGRGRRKMRLGIIGLTQLRNQPSYVRALDPIEAGRATALRLHNQVDVLVALTHMTMEEDQRLAAAVPDLDLVLGGHEHNNVISRDERTRIPIARAGANARFVGIHEIRFDPNTRELEIFSESRPITDEIEEEPATRQEVQEWMEILREYALRARGLPEVRVRVDRHLDGREASVRHRPTALTELIASGMRRAAPGTEVAIFNSGMIRSDEVLRGGEVSSEDVLKMLPFGGSVLSVEMSGSLLQRALDRGQANLGTGGYLQTIGVRREAAGWLVGDVALDPARRYRVALNDYLAAGAERGLEFLRPGPEFRVLGEHGDITQSLLIELLYTQPGAGSMDSAGG